MASRSGRTFRYAVARQPCFPGAGSAGGSTRGKIHVCGQGLPVRIARFLPDPGDVDCSLLSKTTSVDDSSNSLSPPAQPEALHEPQCAAGILPADQPEKSTAGKMSAAPWRCGLTCSRFIVPMNVERRKEVYMNRPASASRLRDLGRVPNDGRWNCPDLNASAKAKGGSPRTPECCRHLAGRPTREMHCRQDAGSTLAVRSHLFEVHSPNECGKTKGGLHEPPGEGTGPTRCRPGPLTRCVERSWSQCMRESERRLSKNPRVLPASCRQTNQRNALPARCRQHLGGAVSLVRGS